MLVESHVKGIRIAYPSAKADPELSVVRLSFPVLALQIVDPERNAWCLFSYTGHVGIPCVPVDVKGLKGGGHFPSSSRLQVFEVVESCQGLAPIDISWLRHKGPGDKVYDESGWECAGSRG